VMPSMIPIRSKFGGLLESHDGSGRQCPLIQN
jgi:hypothetical protein